MRPIFTQETFLRTKIFRNIIVEIFDGKFVSANHILQKIFSAENLIRSTFFRKYKKIPSTKKNPSVIRPNQKISIFEKLILGSDIINSSDVTAFGRNS
jgi:hypothetical protein